jgi:hypothetical protein
MAWLVAGGLVVKVDTEAGRIVGAWRGWRGALVAVMVGHA